jgi:hypothetical protein
MVVRPLGQLLGNLLRAIPVRVFVSLVVLTQTKAETLYLCVVCK